MNNHEIIKFICDYVEEYKKRIGTRTDFQEPLVGFADAKDPLFAELKNIVSPSHALPADIVPKAKSVICYYVPFNKEVVDDNCCRGDAAESWVYAYHETNSLITELNDALYHYLSEKNYPTSNLPPTYNYNEETLCSDWSHRSAAFIAGLGKFGLHRLLITEKGCCGRFGSIITTAEFEATKRPDGEYCLYFAKGKCKKCIEKCPANAISVVDDNPCYDKYACNSHIYDRELPLYPIGRGDACGKCCSGVPCSFQNPVKCTPEK